MEAKVRERNGGLSDRTRSPCTNGVERRSFEPVFRGVGFHSALLRPLQGAPQVLLQACLLSCPLCKLLSLHLANYRMLMCFDEENAFELGACGFSRSNKCSHFLLHV